MRRKIIKFFLVLIALLIITAGFFYFRYKPSNQTEWGLTFSAHEAQGYGFDWKVMYQDILTDLKPDYLRLMTYWEDIERELGKFDFSSADYQIEEAQKRDINVVLVVGRKQPRWPECHQPDWFKNLNVEEQNKAVLGMLKAAMEHFKEYTAIKAWQVENEPYFEFGTACPTLSKELFNSEVALVKSLDSRPIVVTDSGDRGLWLPVSKSGGDIFGATFYRVTYDEMWGGYYKYPLPAFAYRIKAGFLQTFAPNIKEVWDVELQMEPWFTNGALNTPLDLHKTLMNQKVFQSNLDYAQSTGISRHYLWGVEWWYWMAKKHNDWGMWATAKDLFAAQTGRASLIGDEREKSE